MKTFIDVRLRPLFINLLFILLIFNIFSCGDFLELDEPTNQISGNIVFQDKAMALAALSDVYANLRTNTLLNGSLNGAGTLLGCYTDELKSVSTQSPDFKTFYDLGVVPTTPVIDQMWVNAYKQIYAANSIIEGLSNSNSPIDEATRNQLTGEALTIRGILHLYLTSMYDDIPYITGTSYELNMKAVKLPVHEVHKKIQTDLETAEVLLSIDYPTQGRTRFNRSGVQVLLARLHLYQKNWTQAKHYAEAVLQNSGYQLESDLSKVFLKDSRSTIWQFAAPDTGFNTLEGQYYIFTALPPNNVVLSDVLMNSFESGDLRKTNWTKTLTNPTMTYSHPFKYKQHTKTAVSTEQSVVLRIEEAYFILAESNNEIGNMTNAAYYLNILRNRAGLAAVSTLTQSQFRLALEEEKRHEFFTEFGHRFFDLKRWGRLDHVMQNTKPSWQPFRKTLPIPERELLANPFLKPQNYGY